MQEIMTKEKASELEMQLRDAITEGIKAWERAGNLYVRLVEEDSEAKGRLIDAGMTRQFLGMLERLGTGQMLLDVYMADAGLARLPMDDQKRISSDPVDAVVLRDDGTLDTLKVDVLKAPKAMRDQLVGKGHIRSLREQRAWLAAKQNMHSTKIKVDPMPWVVAGHYVNVRSGVKLTRKDLLSMMRALEG